MNTSAVLISSLLFILIQTSGKNRQTHCGHGYDSTAELIPEVKDEPSRRWLYSVLIPSNACYRKTDLRRPIAPAPEEPCSAFLAKGTFLAGFFTAAFFWAAQRFL